MSDNLPRQMEFRILGPFQLIVNHQVLSIEGMRQRALLAFLVLHANEIVPPERLIEEIWRGSSPASGRNTLHAAASRLRKTLGPNAERLGTHPSGYSLKVEAGELDAAVFEQALMAGRAKLEGGQAEIAARELRTALDLWRGPAVADFAHEPFAQVEAARLEELRLQAYEDRFEAELQTGSSESLVPELERLCEKHPFRERFPAQLMLALYRSGRQADALAVYSRTRTTLREELGLEPGSELRELQRAILAQDESLNIPIAGDGREGSLYRFDRRRKTVTVLVSEFTCPPASGEPPDPEALSEIRARYVDVATNVLSTHGGVVQTPVGDAVMAVFGAPTVREDDALRAARASHELRLRASRIAKEAAAIHHLNFDLGIGLETGEVIADVDRDGRVTVTGQPVAVAKRLAQASQGDVLVGAGAIASIGEVIPLEPAASLEVGGHGVPIPMWRLLDPVSVETPSRKNLLDTPFIGRRDELAMLRSALTRTKRTQKGHTFWVLGPAGIGKSRLLQEFASEVSSSAAVLMGRCLPYGESITYWPLREMVRMAGATNRSGIARLLKGTDQADRGTEVVSGLLGLGRETGAITREEAFWAARALLAQIARRRPLVAVFEDVHWAEPTLLDLITYLTDRAADAPLLIVCLARPETMDGWARMPTQDRETIELEPLADEECQQLLANLGWGSDVATEAAVRILRRAGGNPLFLEQLTAWAERSPRQGDPAIPPTIQALLASRLDLLGPAEREVLERAAVVGSEVPLDFLEAQLPEDARSSARGSLEELVRQRILLPVQPNQRGTGSLRFRHVLIRDVAYRAVPKALRARLHEAYAEWLGSDDSLHTSESDAVLGYHLEQAARSRAEVSPSDPHAGRLAHRAGMTLFAAGRGAMAHGDVPGATNLLRRAAALLPRRDAARVALLPELGEALTEAGRLDEGRAILREAIELADEVDDSGVYWRALCADGWWRLRVDQEPRDNLEHLAQEAIQALQEGGSDAGLAHAWRLLAEVHHSRGHYTRAGVALERAFEHAQRAGSRHEAFASLSVLGIALVYGPMPVGAAVSILSRIRSRIGNDPPLEAAVLRPLGGLRALQGRIEEARRLINRARATFGELGWRWALAAIPFVSGLVEDRAGDHAAAESDLRRGAELFAEMGERGAQATMLGGLGLAETLYQLGRYDEAEECAERSLRLTPSDYMEDLALSNAVRAKVLARRGEFVKAEQLARRTDEIAVSTDSFIIRTGTLLSVAEVLRLADRADEAVPRIRQALGLYEAKGDVISARRTRELLTELGAG